METHVPQQEPLLYYAKKENKDGVAKPQGHRIGDATQRDRGVVGERRGVRDDGCSDIGGEQKGDSPQWGSNPRPRD